MREAGWLQFLDRFPGDHPTADSFRAACRRAAGGAALDSLVAAWAAARALRAGFAAPAEGRRDFDIEGMVYV